MSSVTIAETDERLRHLPPKKLIVVYDFVSYLLERDIADLLNDADTDAQATATDLRRYYHGVLGGGFYGDSNHDGSN